MEVLPTEAKPFHGAAPSLPLKPTPVDPPKQEPPPPTEEKVYMHTYVLLNVYRTVKSITLVRVDFTVHVCMYIRQCIYAGTLSHSLRINEDLIAQYTYIRMYHRSGNFHVFQEFASMVP